MTDVRPHRSRVAIIYVATNLLNGRRYIGITSKTVRARQLEHVSAAMRAKHGGHFHRAIRKYGAEMFRFRAIASFGSYNEAVEAEVRLIAILRPEYNSTKGGDGGCGVIWSAESRAKISASKKGRSFNLGHKHSAAMREKLRIIGKSNRDKWAPFAALGPAKQSKPVICLDDGTCYRNARAAAEAYGVCKVQVTQVCLRQPSRLTAGGKMFRYVSEVPQ